MRPLSKRIEEWESRLNRRYCKRLRRVWRKWRSRWPLLLGMAYFYGMLINSIARGIARTFAPEGDSRPLWELNPILNLAALFTPMGLAVTMFVCVMAILCTKTGYRWLSGFKGVRDPRGFEILPEGTHGTGGWMDKAHLETVCETGRPEELHGVVIGKLQDEGDSPEDALYVSPKEDNGLNRHCLIYGASGTGKSRGFVKPFILKTIQNGKRGKEESLVCLDPKGELYDSTSAFARQNGYTVRVYNLLDMLNSDGFNCMSDIESDKTLIQSVAEVIIRNTSGPDEKRDFWEKAELNLLMAMLHYVVDMRDEKGELLPIEDRSLGVIYRLLSAKSVRELESMFHQLALREPHHPALAPYGLFQQDAKAVEGNIITGLGTRLSVFQNKLVDTITRYNDIDLTLPGRAPCVYYCIISAQDSSLEFLSSMFFSLMFTRLASEARRKGINGRLPITVNMLMDEFCNCGTINDFKKILSVCRSQGINCQLIIQGLAQLSDRYDHNQWEELVGNCDCQLFLGCNDKMTADYVSKKCSTVTIRTVSSSTPVSPLFFPLANDRPGSESRQNTRRELMLPDELLSLDNRKCIALFRGQRPLMLWKIIPEELPGYEELKPIRITDYRPAWRELEERRETEKTAPAEPVEPPPEPGQQEPLVFELAREEPAPAGSGLYQYNYDTGQVELHGGFQDIDPAEINTTVMGRKKHHAGSTNP